jgi:antitoxin (DNA-binding transcriptional repressor) of toxin-antitoxin stability system
VEASEKIVIARNGKAVAKLVPTDERANVQGSMRGKIPVNADFDTPLPVEVAAAFRGERL